MARMAVSSRAAVSTDHGQRLLGCVRRAPVAALSLVLAGCGLFNDAILLPCPRGVVLADAAELVDFRPGPGRDLTDVRLEAAISGVRSVCEYDRDGFVDVDLDVAIDLTRGPALEGEAARAAFFVVITDSQDKVVAKRVFALDVEFPGATLRARTVQELTQRIHYLPEPSAAAYRIFVGFQLTRDQLDYLRARKR